MPNNDLHHKYIKPHYNTLNNNTSINYNSTINPLSKIELNEAGSITTSLPINKTSTVFSKYGNKFFIILIFLYIFLIFYFKKVEKNEEKKLSFYQ